MSENPNVSVPSPLLQGQVDSTMRQLDWMNDMKQKYDYDIVEMPEWVDESWRKSEGGFNGTDFCHSRQASVRIMEYLLLKGTYEGLNEQVDVSRLPRLVGSVFFTSRAESHRGLCHGGSMCAVMDDVIGWMGFCADGTVKPWSGFTVQVNTTLKKPVKVGSILKLEAWVNRFEGERKVWISAELSNPTTGEVHCVGEGLYLKPTSAPARKEESN